MTKAACIDCLGDRFTQFKRFAEHDEYELDFRDEHVQVLLSVGDVIRNISVFRPREVKLSGIQLLDVEIGVVETQLREAGFNVEACDAGLWLPSEKVVLIVVDGRIDGVQIETI
ncbi:MAG: hypothetical protein R3C10_05575 [Pirellulales bacterium]